MTTANAGTDSSTIDVAGVPLSYESSGEGPVMALLPHETGSMGAGELQRLLAENHRVAAPTLPGWDGTPRHEWMGSVRDMAVLMNLTLDKRDAGPINLVGLGFGAWIAAEMATMNQDRIAHLILVNPMGLQPNDGEIMDQFLLGHEAYLQAGYHDLDRMAAHYSDGQPSVDELVEQDENREMTARIAWKPYMFSQTQAQLLTEVRIPTRVLISSHDQIVPPSCGQQYVDAMPNATLGRIDDAGHFAAIEQPAALAQAITEFCAT